MVGIGRVMRMLLCTIDKLLYTCCSQIRDGTSTETSEQVPSQDDSGRSSSIIPQSTDSKFREGLAVAIAVAIIAIILNLIQYFY